jgi:hypothetical protein
LSIVQNVNFRDLFRLLYLLNNGGNVFKILLILLIKIYKEYQKNQLDIVETSEALKKYQNQQQTMRLYAPIAGFEIS